MGRYASACMLSEQYFTGNILNIQIYEKKKKTKNDVPEPLLQTLERASDEIYR